MRLRDQDRKPRNRSMYDLDTIREVALQISRQRMTFSINDAGTINELNEQKNYIPSSQHILWKKINFYLKTKNGKS